MGVVLLFPALIIGLNFIAGLRIVCVLLPCQQLIDPSAPQIVDAMVAFYKEEISCKFPEKSFVFDAYLRERDWRVRSQLHDASTL